LDSGGFGTGIAKSFNRRYNRTKCMVSKASGPVEGFTHRGGNSGFSIEIQSVIKI
jgi:hypothetical protein